MNNIQKELLATNAVNELERHCRIERVRTKPAYWNIHALTIMRLCPECGNKRCPHVDKQFMCTGSNEPGQVGVLIRGPAQIASACYPLVTPPGPPPKDGWMPAYYRWWNDDEFWSQSAVLTATL